MFRSPLENALAHAVKYLDSLDSRPVGPHCDLASLRAALGKPLSDHPTDPIQVIDDLAHDVEHALMATGSARFFAWVMGGTLPPALAADWLTSAWDQNAGIYSTSPAAAVVEEVAGCWLKDLLRLPPDASFALVTGCQMAHTTCLAAARHHLLARQGWDVERDGLRGSPALRIIATEERHGTVERALRLLGFGAGNILYIPPDPARLETVLAADPAPAIVLLQAGELNTGAFDHFPALIPIAHRYQAWVHIDGAFGLWAAASPRFRHLTAGVDAADSWATDGHKWLNVPYDCGYAFVAHPESHRAAMTYAAGYLPASDAARDQLDWGPEFSRRARAFPTYAAIRYLGRSGIAAMVERCCDCARDLVSALRGIPGVEVLAEPVINQALVRFPDPAGIDHDRNTDRVIAAIQADGEAFFGGVTWRGMRAMRISVCNWQTGPSDIERTAAAIARLVA